MPPPPPYRASADVFGECEQRASPPVGAGGGVAGVCRHGDLAERGCVPHRAEAVEGGAAQAPPALGRHQHVAGAAVLALLTAGGARVLVLAVLADVVRGASVEKRIRIDKWKTMLEKFKLLSRQLLFFNKEEINDSFFDLNIISR